MQTAPSDLKDCLPTDLSISPFIQKLLKQLHSVQARLTSKVVVTTERGGGGGRRETNTSQEVTQ